MKFKAFLAVALASVPFAAHAADVDLGSTQRVTNLYSYPNCLSNCPSPQYPQTLPQTVSHYLQQSITRDGLLGSSVTISQTGKDVIAHFTGPAAKTYPAAVTKFLAAGDLAWAATVKIQGEGKWKSDWRFFLPQGLAMTQNPTVELLHFPPDYSLTQQDYLGAATTDRWAGLLTVNGVPAAETDGYQAIVDIAPIAAPASAGSDIEAANVYGDYSNYAFTLLSGWVAGGKPMVAFGSPVRTWVQTYLGQTIAVDQAAVVQFPNGGPQVPVIGSNHPSMIFYAAYNSDHTENFSAGMKVMTQDLIAACWQAGMGKTPSQNPQTVQQSCSTHWTQDSYDACMLLETTIYKKTQQQAVAACSAGGALRSQVELSDEEASKLEK